LGTVYFGDRREHAHKVSIEDKIKLGRKLSIILLGVMTCFRLKPLNF